MIKKIITEVKGRMVFDSRGYPTVEAEIIVMNKYSGIAIAPSGQLLQKIMSNLEEVRARGGQLFVLADDENITKN